MRNTKNRQKINIKLFLGIFLLLFFVVIILVNLVKGKDKNENLDYKLGVVASDGVALVSISNERKMVNVLSLNKDVKVWIPGGKAWIESGKTKEILQQEKKNDLADSVFWYNFGFMPDKILFLDSINQWKDSSVLINNLGFINWLKYKKNYDKMFLKQEEISNNLTESGLVLDEIMVRDFSESKLNNEELRLSIFNNTSESGLAGFMTKRLEWSGFSVVSADNNSNEKVNGCLIVYGKKTDSSYGWKMINKIFNCEKRFDENLNENELELYFGDNLASMIKYSSYSK